VTKIKEGGRDFEGGRQGGGIYAPDRAEGPSGQSLARKPNPNVGRSHLMLTARLKRRGGPRCSGLRGPSREDT
jgi:hypothetical protein